MDLEKEDEEQEKRFSSLREILIDYAQDSTIQGLGYIFSSHQTLIGKVFWSFVLMFMFSLGIYWCQQAYMDWTDSPVLTTVTTTSFSINEVSCRTDPNYISLHNFI